MQIDRLVKEELSCETRAAALAGGRAVALWSDSPLRPQAARLGARLDARITKVAPDQGGVFLELDSGEPAFLRGDPPGGAGEGSRIEVDVLAEARRGKLARVAPAQGPASAGDPFQRWLDRLPLGKRPDIETGPEAAATIDAAFEEALDPTVTLPGGGRLTLARTPALTAIDIDTAGRVARGKAGPAAINREAAGEAAIQLALRSLGGLAVLDCIAPVGRTAGPKLKTHFLTLFRSLSRRRAAALAPSPFGLMEIQLAWGERPVDEAHIGTNGKRLPLAILLDGLRRLEREAMARPAARLVLVLPEAAYIEAAGRHGDIETALAAKYGSRLSLRAGTGETVEIEAP